MAEISSSATITLDIQNANASSNSNSLNNNLLEKLNSSISKLNDRIEQLKTFSKINNNQNLSDNTLNQRFTRINSEYERSVQKQLDNEVKTTQTRNIKLANEQERILRTQINNDEKIFQQQEKQYQREQSLKQKQLDNEIRRSNKLDSIIQISSNAIDAKQRLDRDYGIKDKGFFTQNNESINNFNDAVDDYNKSQKTNVNSNLSTLVSAGMVSKFISDFGSNLSNYLRSSNALIGANQYQLPVARAEEFAGRNRATNSLIGTGITAGLAGAGTLIGGVGGGIIGAGLGSAVSSNLDYQAERQSRYSIQEAELQRQQLNLSVMTRSRLQKYKSPESGNDIWVTQDFANLANSRGLPAAYSFQAAQQGILLNNTGTRGLTGIGANNLASSVQQRLGSQYDAAQISNMGSILSGLFAHTGITDNTKKQTDILQQILDNAKKYGVNPIQYAQSLYNRQTTMGGSIDSAMQFNNMALTQGPTYANAINQIDRAPISQRLQGEFALGMVGFKGGYNSLVQPGGIDRLNKSFGDLRDPFNINGMILQNAGFNGWDTRTGATNNNDDATMKNTDAIVNLTNTINSKLDMNNNSNNNYTDWNSLQSLVPNYNQKTYPQTMTNSNSLFDPNATDVVPPIIVTH